MIKEQLMKDTQATARSVPEIATLNGFERQSNGVYATVSSSADFGYSDGENVERTFDKILSSSEDLSSQSAELESQVSDWPTEYHLSSTRANLLRPLNLSTSKRVLELGCGCGSISRYLAEQSHLTVDAIEGSPVRAALAAKRCKDLDNINFLTANFNALKIPENHYDLVLFVGVLEYAGRFSDGRSDQQAVLDLLELAKRSLTKTGVVVVAIENRTGLKYLMGAREDHYAIPFIGLDDYPDSTGIRTYNHAQWLELIDQSPFGASKTLLPFPDYKIPHLLIDADSGSLDKASAVDALGRIESRDYCSPQNSFPMAENEPRIWQGVVEADSLTQLSNSYLLLLGSDAADITQLSPKQSVTELSKPAFNYIDENVHIEPSPYARINELSQQLDATKTHADELQRITVAERERLAQIEHSLGWRLVRSMQRLFGRL